MKNSIINFISHLLGNGIVCSKFAKSCRRISIEIMSLDFVNLLVIYLQLFAIFMIFRRISYMSWILKLEENLFLFQNHSRPLSPYFGLFRK